MKEELLISGRNNFKIDPVLEAWGWEIPVYLFLGGLSAGILFFAGLYFLMGKENAYATAVKKAPILVPIFIGLGLFALFLDLHHKPYFWRLYTTIKIQSPMSWGAWTLMAVMPISMIWAALNIKEIFPKWDWKFEIIKQILAFFEKQKKYLAYAMVLFGFILGIYTGILFSAFNARPLWNTSILGPLFLASGLSAGAALIMFMSKDHKERLLFSKLDLLVIAIEIFLVIHMFMGFLASTQVQQDAAQLFLGGKYTVAFWGGAVLLGMVVPAVLEFMEIKKFKVPVAVPAVLILSGGLILRFVITYAGQASRYLY